MMEDIVYVKIEQNVCVKNRQILLKDIGTFYSYHKKVTQELEKEVFYTLSAQGQNQTVFTIAKVYEAIHRVYPGIAIENIGETDFIVEYQPEKKSNLFLEWAKTIIATLIVFFGAAFTIMTFNEDVGIGSLFDKVYVAVMGVEHTGGSLLDLSYCIGLPIGILVFYNHYKTKKDRRDLTPIQTEMRNYEEQMNKALIKTSSREGKTIDTN